MKRKESHSIEFKQSWRSEYLKVISAFANSEGGSLYIGLDDDGNPVPLKNVKNGVMSVIFYKDRWGENHLKKLGLNERQIKAVIYAREAGEISNSIYQKINNVGKTTATNELSELVKMGLLAEPTAKGRGAKYKLKKLIGQ